MKKIILTVLAVIALIVVIVLIIASTKPDSFRVERNITINAKPEKIYAFVNDFHNWKAWSPFEKLDTAMTKTFSGAEKGIGAKYEWKGNSNAGAGKMEITDTTSTKISITIDFIEPIESKNYIEFTFEPDENGTNVTWAMNGPSEFISKVMQVFFSMDKMIGKDFEEGLGNLKNLAEKQ